MITTNKRPVDLYERAVGYILNCPKTEQQMRQWFARKTNDQTLIEDYIARLQTYHFLDDEDYALQYVQCKKDKMGLNLIKNKLRLNGVNSAIIERVTAEIDDQRELIMANVEKYLRNKDRTPETKAKLFRWLLSKGFNYDGCVEVVNEYWH